MALAEINESNFKAETSTGLVVIDCWAEWCGPCRMVAPVLEEIAKEDSAVAIKKLNVDFNQNIARDLGIQSIPTLLLYKNGELVDKVIGALPKPQLKKFIDRHK